MKSAKKNLIETEVRKSLGGGRIDLILRWREAGTHWRRIQGETYRIAGRVCEASETERWVVDADVGCGVIGRGMLATLVTLELAEADAGEQARAEALLRKVATGIKG